MKRANSIKRFFVLMLAILTLVGLMPITALADVPYSSAYDVDGAGTNAFSASLPGIYTVEEDVSLPDIPFMTLLEAPAATGVSTAEELTAVFQNGGEAVLDSNITLVAPLIAASGKTIILDLNGKTIDRGLTEQAAQLSGNVITVEGSLTLNDSLGTGEITGGKKSGYTGGGGVYVNGGEFTMNGGSISGNAAADGGGGGIFVESGTFVMNGGAISGNTTAGGGGGARVNSGEFTMSGGSISGNTAKQSGGVFVDGGTFTMNTGIISGNTAAGTEAGTGYGGGVSVLYGGSFIMKDGEISSNTVEGYGSMAGQGGGVFVNMSGSFTFDGGTISLNEAEYGGGVYLDGSPYLTGPASSFTMSAGEISQNTTDSLSASGGGGGVYVASGNFTINGGRISRNEAAQGGGIYILGGSCAMTDCEIIENNTFEALSCHGGGVYLASGNLTMNSGKINKNRAANGGGVYEFGGAFNMKGGQINENAAYVLEGQMCDGGGVYLNNGTFSMEGGEIRGNATSAWTMYNHGGGVFVYGGAIRISGGSSITDNSRSGVPDNVYLKAESNKIEVAGALTGADGTIGISTGNAPEETTSLVVAQGSGYTISEADCTKFARDMGGTLNLSDNKIILPDPSTSYLTFLSYDANGGSGTHGSAAIVEGMENHLTVASGDGFSRTNCSFAGWNTQADGRGASYQADDILILTENTRLYAQWTINRTELTMTAPQGGVEPSTSAACVPSGITAAVVWKQGEENLIGSFDYNTVYSAEITLTAGSGCTFADTPAALLNGQPADIESRSDAALEVSYTFAKTGPRGIPAATLSPISYNVANTGGISSLTLNVSGIVDGYNPVTWTMSKTDGSNILTLPSTTTGMLANGALDIGSVAVAANAAGQPDKTASATITFGGNADGEYAGVPASITVVFRLAAGNGPNASLDYTNEKITGVSDEMEYIVNSSLSAPGNWTGATPVSGTEIAISGVIPEAGAGSKYIHIRFAGINGSVPQNIEIPARPDLFDIIDRDSWVDHNIENDIESGYVPWDFSYRINNGDDEAGSSDDYLVIPLAPGATLTFWLPATSSSFKSGEIAVTAPARLEKPNVAIDFEQEKLNTDTSMQYRLNDEDDWSECTADMTLPDFGWNGTAAVTVQFRYPYTADNYASDPQLLTIPVADGTGSVTMSGWTYGNPAPEPVPVSATNGTGNVTYTYSGTKADGTPYSSSTKPSEAGNYNVTATFGATSEYKPVSSEPASFTIRKKEIDVQWTNLHYVYDGTEKAATLTLPNLEPGDAGAASVSISDGQRINAGFQRVTASLGGSRAFNYTLTNPVGTLTIQRAPVTFTVGNDSVLHDGEPKTATITATANGALFGSFSVTYKRGGTAVPAPAEAGIYDIYASFADTNYRHVDSADGAERKIGVLTIFDQAPAVFKTSFIPGNGSGTMNDLADAVAGTVRILPDCTFTEAAGGYVFSGWMLEGNLYPAGAAFIQPARNVSFTAQWAHVHSVSGEVTRNGSPAEGAVVTLMHGAQRIGETVADAQGRYQFSNVPPGIYNLTGAKDGITITIKKEIQTADVTGADIALPVGRTNSVVEVRAGTPAIVVGNLEKIFEQQDGIVFTGADQTTIDSGGTVEIRIVVEVISEDTEDSDQKMIMDQARSNPGLYLEMSLKKSVSSGGSPAEILLAASNVLLDIVVPLPAELQGKDSYIVYRCHNGTTVHTLTTTQNGDGEYIAVNADKTAITIHAKLFSTYAVGYLDQEVPGNGGNGSRPAKAAPVKTTGLPYYLDADGNKIFLGFSFDSNGTMKYLAPEGKTVLFGENPKNFKDIGNHWAKSGIDFVAQREIFQGTGKEIFSPDAGMTRGMFAAAIGRLYERSCGWITPSGAATFTDVAANSYYAAYADWAEENGIMKGSGDEKFNPDRLITREEMASVLYRFARFLELSGTETTGIQLNYSDTSEISSWATDAARYCQKTNLITGRGGGKFASKETATRGEVATILERFIKAVV